MALQCHGQQKLEAVLLQWNVDLTVNDNGDFVRT